MQFRKANNFIVSVKHKFVLYELELRAYGLELEFKAYIDIEFYCKMTEMRK
jgi:hypothetical protein